MAPQRWRKRGGKPLFRDRTDAGKRLGARLGALRDDESLVLALPRGGVPVAAEVARELDAELDVIVARKVGAPQQPELAIGAVTADGGLFLDTVTVDDLGVSQDVLETRIAQERETARQREHRFRADRAWPPLEQHTVIVVDDGLATGATMSAAVHAIRKRKPARLVAAVPVGSTYACDTIGAEVDEIVCLFTPEPFRSVGLFYGDFSQVDDDEVERVLGTFRDAKPSTD